MKKLLLIVSMSLLFLEQASFASASSRRYVRSQSTSANTQKKSSVTSMLKKNSGSAENLATALGIKLDSLKEYQGWGIVGTPFGRKYKWEDAFDEKYMYELDAQGKRQKDSADNDIKRELTPDELEEKKIEKINKVRDWYAARYTSPAEKALMELNQDIQAFQDKFEKDKIQNVDLQEKIKSLVDIAQQAGQDLFFMLVDQQATKILQGRTLNEAIKESELKHTLAKQLKNELQIEIYQDIIEQLKNIDAELQDVKRQHRKNALMMAEKMLLEFQMNEDAYQVYVYGLIIEQLKMEAKVGQDIENTIKDLIDKDGELKALQESEKALVKIKKQLSDAKRDNRPDDIIQTLEMDVKKQENIVYELKSKSEIAIEDKMDKMLNNNNNDPKKALDHLLKKYKSTDYLGIGNVANVVTSYDSQINNIKEDTAENCLNKAVAKKLNAKIKEAAQKLEGEKQEQNANDPVNIALAQLRAAPPLQYPKALEGVIAAMFGKAGVSMDSLDMADRQKIAELLQNTSKQMVTITQDTQISAAMKQQQKQDVTKSMVKEISYLLLHATTGVSKKNLQSKNLAGGLLDMSASYLNNKSKQSNASNSRGSSDALDSYDF